MNSNGVCTKNLSPDRFRKREFLSGICRLGAHSSGRIMRKARGEEEKEFRNKLFFLDFMRKESI